jgi:EAL domain-containing protein (putative c-di-GMP-specific phosphodiesterase class I)
MVVVAEGVETGSQLSKLKELHCDEVQGFLLARPLNAGDFEDFMSRRPRVRKAKALVRERCTPVSGRLAVEN